MRVVQKKNFSFSSLIIVLLLSSCGSSETIQKKENTKRIDRSAAEASAAETKISFWDLPYLKKAFIDTAPVDRKDGIIVGELSANGRNKDQIIKLAK